MFSPQLLAAAVAALLLGVALLSWHQDAQFDEVAVRASGVVTGYEIRKTRALLVEEEAAFPVIEFTDAKGREHSFESPVEGRRLGFGPDREAWAGEAVAVEYDPERPERARPVVRGEGQGRLLLGLLAVSLLAAPRLLRFAFGASR